MGSSSPTPSFSPLAALLWTIQTPPPQPLPLPAQGVKGPVFCPSTGSELLVNCGTTIE